jgi:hypothetical protein
MVRELSKDPFGVAEQVSDVEGYQFHVCMITI